MARTAGVIWTATREAGLRRAYAWNGETLWLRSTGAGFIIRGGQTVWESDTAGTAERVEAAARALGIVLAHDSEDEA